MKNCKECLADIQGFLLDRLVVMSMESKHFVKLELEIEKFMNQRWAEANRVDEPIPSKAPKE